MICQTKVEKKFCSKMLQVKAYSETKAKEKSNNIISNTSNAVTDDGPVNDMNSEDSTNHVKTAFKTKSYESNYNEEDYSCFNDGSNLIKSTREKTPMCLVNDLARFNKISFQYRLTGEKGPAHCKQFTVTLELGDEEYTAHGYKIKKAQHLAAKEAMQRTKYKHPVPKLSRQNEVLGTSRSNVTPTVELNALAMKLGQQTYYIFDPRQMASCQNTCTFENVQQSRYKNKQALGSNVHMNSIFISEQTQVHSNISYNGTFVPNMSSNPAIIRVHQGSHNRKKVQHCYPVSASSQHLHSALFPSCTITLIVGTQKFYGVGRTIQQAKHDAAAQAIVKLKEHMVSEQIEAVVEKINENDHKSPISLVFEIGTKRNMSVDFKILREDGPAHMRKFITACIVGDIVTEGEGTGKKISKKKAALKMIEELNKLSPVLHGNSPMKRNNCKTPTKKRLSSPLKNKNVSQIQKLNTEKCQKSDSDFDNPIVKMVEWCKEKNYSEPIFKIITEKGKDKSRRGQYVVEVTSNDFTTQGLGNSKKSAKRNAAQNFLMSIGSITSEQLSASAADINPASSRHKIVRNSDKNCLTLDVPNMVDKHSVCSVDIPSSSRPKIVQNPEKDDATIKLYDPLIASNAAAVSGELSIECDSNTTPFPNKTHMFSSTKVKSNGFHMKDKLLYLARLIGFEVDFSDYPKGNHNEFLTILMMSTNPPQICHGVGANAEESQEDASKNALQILSEMGINNTMN